MKMKKYTYYILLFTLAIVCLFGCKKAKNDTEEDVIQDLDSAIGQSVTNEPLPSDDATTQGPTAAPTNPNHDGEMRSTLSGLWVPTDVGNKRPYAIIFNNYRTVSNQSSLIQADIVYEALVEGGITRFLGVGENFTGDRIGSARSARHYFVSIADEYDAIFIHYGRTKYALSKMQELGIDHMDGSEGIGTTVYYRDKSIRAPHNAFASLKGILAGIKKKGFRTTHKAGFEPHYSFYEDDTDLTSGTTVNKVTIKFSAYTNPYLVYDSKDKLYDRFQFGAPHKDAVTGEQLKFKNIIIQFVKEWNIDHNGYQTMDLTNASGKGYYITNGKMIPITWKKKESDKWMRYYNESGEELTINPGKTYIALFPNNRTKDVVLE